MAICASCGRPVDTVKSRQRACQSCTWRAALRVSQTSSVDETAAPASTSPFPIDDTDELTLDAGQDPVTMVLLLCDFASAAGDAVAHERARRVHVALLRGNRRPYHAEMNRLIGRFIDRLEAHFHLERRAFRSGV